MRQTTGQGLIVGAAGAALIALAFLIGWRVVEYQRVQPVPILMYHHIGNVEDSAWCVPPDVFERQMKFLRDQGYTSILPSDLAAHRRWGSPLPRRPVIITFDDGYLNTMTMAEPILKKYGLQGIVYLVTDCVAAVPCERRQLEGAECLTWSEVREMQQRGTMAFGGHSHSHQNLAVAADPFSLASECFRQIRRNGGFIPDSFCYPHGEYNDRVLEAVRRVGFATAMVCEDTVAKTGPGVKLLALPRVSVMGGRHRFTVTRAQDKESAGAVVFRVKHEGVPMEVSPRLTGIAGDRWLPPKELGNRDDVEWRWTLSDSSTRDKPLSLEIWDRNRVFLLYPCEGRKNGG